MASRPTRVIVLAILIATLLTVATPMSAQASRSADFDSGFTTHVERVLDKAGSALVSLWDGFLGFMAASTAAICGDG